jgi:hypothetical protein
MKDEVTAVGMPFFFRFVRWGTKRPRAVEEVAARG